MLHGLDSLEEFNKKDEPQFMDFVYHLFWDKGIGYQDFNNLPMPYIFSIIKTENYFKKKEEKAYKKASKR